MIKSFFCALALSLMSASLAAAAEIKIVDIKAYLFLEQSGKISGDIIGAPPFVNLPKGGGPNHEMATGIILDMIFSGDKETAPKFATATIDITQAGKPGQQVTTHKALAAFNFGADGLEHKALFLENATCMSATILVRAGKSQKTAKLDFACKE